MLFTRYWRGKVEAMERNLAVLEAKLQERDALLASHTQLIKSFQKLQDQYTEGLVRARQTIEELSAVAEKAEPSFSSEPLYYTEEEEDLKALKDQGILTPEAYEEALRSLR